MLTIRTCAHRSAGSTLDWPSTQAAADQIRKSGVEVSWELGYTCNLPIFKHLLTIGQQLIALWQTYKDREDDVFLWGDEVMIDIQETRGFSLAKAELIFEADGRISGRF